MPKPSLIERMLDRLFERIDISRSDIGVYLTRWILWGNRYQSRHRFYLHLFHRGDAEGYPHDHPWPFWSFILKGGYWEFTEFVGQLVHDADRLCWESGCGNRPPDFIGRWYGPLRLLRRPAEWAHFVELPLGRRCWTIVWTGQKVRSWGFWTPCGFLPWREHAKKLEAGVPICEEDQ